MMGDKMMNEVCVNRKLVYRVRRWPKADRRLRMFLEI